MTWISSSYNWTELRLIWAEALDKWWTSAIHTRTSQSAALETWTVVFHKFEVSRPILSFMAMNWLMRLFFISLSCSFNLCKQASISLIWASVANTDVETSSITVCCKTKTLQHAIRRQWHPFICLLKVKLWPPVLQSTIPSNLLWWIEQTPAIKEPPDKDRVLNKWYWSLCRFPTD